MSVQPLKSRRKYKSFACMTLIFLLVFAGINFLIWSCFTKELLTPDSEARDLVRLSYLVKIQQRRDEGVDLPVRHIDISEVKGQRVDMVTVGDSFSRGGGGGKNAFYQDYIASYNNFRVVNFKSKLDMGRAGFFTPVNSLATLYNSGVLDRIKPRYVLLESVERYAPERLAFNFSFDDTDSPERLMTHTATGRPLDLLGNDNVMFINSGNWKFLYNNIKDLFPITKVNNSVYRAELRQPLFSGNYGDRLYYYFDEYTNSVNLTKETVRVMNDNLNFIADKLAQKNIKFIFMPVVSKLTLYGAYADPPRNEGIFFEELRKLPKNYQLIDTKALLNEALQRGEKDIFFKDDSHWSWKASKQIFENVKFD